MKNREWNYVVAENKFTLPQSQTKINPTRVAELWCVLSLIDSWSVGSLKNPDEAKVLSLFFLLIITNINRKQSMCLRRHKRICTQDYSECIFCRLGFEQETVRERPRTLADIDGFIIFRMRWGSEGLPSVIHTLSTHVGNTVTQMIINDFDE